MRPLQRIALVFALAFAPLPAHAQGSAAERASELLHRAQQAYFRMRMDEAERDVIEAVAICEREGCPASDRAVLYLALGAIAHTASGDGLRARMAFDRALDLDPDVALDLNLATEDVRRLFDEVRAMRRREEPAPQATQRSAPAPGGGPPIEDAAAVCTSDAGCGPGRGCVGGVCDAGAAEGGEAEPPREAPRRRRTFFAELGYALTSAFAHDDMQVTRRPETSFYGEDLQLDPRFDNDSYVLSGRYGCEAPTSEYCVRVTDGAFAFAHGFHATLGAYVTEHFGLAARVRLAPAAGGGSFDRLVLGARFYYRPIAPLPEGFHFAVFVGPMYGQIQVRPKQETTVQGAAIARPWGRTGPYGAEVGFPFGRRFTPGFGFFVSPEVYVLAPSFSFGLQLTTGVDFTLGWARR